MVLDDLPYTTEVEALVSMRGDVAEAVDLAPSSYRGPPTMSVPRLPRQHRRTCRAARALSVGRGAGTGGPRRGGRRRSGPRPPGQRSCAPASALGGRRARGGKAASSPRASPPAPDRTAG